MNMERKVNYKTSFLRLLVAFSQIFLANVKSNEQLQFRKAFYVNKPGPHVQQTHGKIWPKPQLQKEESEIFFTLNPNNFSFKVKIRNIIYKVLS